MIVKYLHRIVYKLYACGRFSGNVKERAPFRKGQLNYSKVWEKVQPYLRLFLKIVKEKALYEKGIRKAGRKAKQSPIMREGKGKKGKGGDPPAGVGCAILFDLRFASPVKLFQNGTF